MTKQFCLSLYQVAIFTVQKFGFLFAIVAEIFSKQLVLSRRYADLEFLHFVTELAPESGAY